MSSNDENPYEVLEIDRAVPTGFATSPNWYTVEDGLLVCAEAVTLPNICVYTGSTEDLLERTCVAHYPSFRLVLFQRTCIITYFVLRKEQRRWVRIWGITIVGMIGGVLLIFSGLVALSGLTSLFGLVVTVLSIVVGLIFGAFQSVNPRIARYEAPGIFRIRGFPKLFLATLASQLIMNQDHPRT